MKIKGLAMEILELIAVSIDFPCSLINRFECSSRNIYRIIGRLIDAGLIKRFRKDKMGSLRLTNKGQTYILEHDRGRIGKLGDNRKYSKSETEKRRRLQRIASTYIAMRNGGVKIYKDQKPEMFCKSNIGEVEIKEPIFYSSLEIKELGIECTKIKFCRAVGILLTSNEDGFIVYNSQNALMKWSSRAEQRIDGALSGLLLACGIQIDYFAGLMIGENMELLKKILLSDGGRKNQLFKLDNTFNEFYYVPEDKNGDFMISILVNKEIRNQIDKELVEMFGITECLMPYACAGMDRKGQPVLFAYDLNMVNLRKFKSGLEMFEERGLVVCFEFQRKVLEEYFGDLANIMIIEV